jgi:hypothetical protein
MIEGKSLTVHAMKEGVVGIRNECDSHTIQGRDSVSWQWGMGSISCRRMFIIEHHSSLMKHS